jgi:small subunit ribosomal protein S5
MKMGKGHKRGLPRRATKQETTGKTAIDVSDKGTSGELKEASRIAAERAGRAEALGREWTPRTTLGRKVLNGEITDIETLFENGVKITEPQIVDLLIPDLRNDIILIGGSGGKGGGKRRTPSKRTTRMHKSGRRFRLSAMVVVGNGNGYVGVGKAHGPPGQHREVVEKALVKAKLSLIPIRRGCGSWECACGTPHSVPFEVTGKSGSVKITLKPAPKGVGLVVMDEIKKVLRLAGIRDVWSKSMGQTSTRLNTIEAVFDAFSRMNKFRTRPDYEKAVGMTEGRAGT